MKIYYLSFLFVSAVGLGIDSKDIFKELKNDPNFRGSVCAFTPKLGHVSLAKGPQDLEKKIDLNEQSVFPIASDSKMMIAAAILKLQSEKKLSISDRITKYIPELLTSKLSSDWKLVKVLHLLNHLGGNGEFYDTNFYRTNQFQRKITLEEILSTLNDIKFVSKPDVKFNYSNFGYILLGMILKKVSKTDLDLFMQDNFFHRLQMTSTTLGSTLEQTLAKSYILKNNSLVDFFKDRGIKDPHLNEVFTDGNIFSTPCDQLKWAMAIYNKDLLPKEMMDLYISPEPKSEYSFGLMKYVDKNRFFIAHTGSWVNYRNSFIVDIASKQMMAFATNSLSDEDFKKYSRQIKNLILYP